MTTTTKKTKQTTKNVNTPGALVLQWLTYAFWGWTALALTWLTALGVSFYLNRSNLGDGDVAEIIPYSLAAVIVLFLISAVVDTVYSRREPVQKHGASTIIMIIHAVIFALCGIAALITAVFAVINMLIGAGSDGNEGAQTTLVTGSVIALVFGAALLRTLRPARLPKASLLFIIFMALITLGSTVVAITGPAAYARQTKDDRLIERGLPDVANSIRKHTLKSDALPQSLSVIRDSTTKDGKELIDRNLVEYVPGKKVQDTSKKYLAEQFIADPTPDYTYEYRLCVTYRSQKDTDYIYSTDRISDGRDVSPDTYAHDKGRVCYALSTGFDPYY